MKLPSVWVTTVFIDENEDFIFGRFFRLTVAGR
jgi:hypothetical protein